MYRAVHTGHPVAVVSATRGEAGKIADPRLATEENLGKVREGELRSACAAVGVDDVTFLDYLDGHLHEADPKEAVQRIVAQLCRFRPDVVVTFAPNGGYGHLDHMAIHRFTLEAIRAAADESAGDVRGGASPHRVAKVYYMAMPRSRLMKMREEALQRGQDFVPGGDAGTIPLEEMGTPDELITTRVTLTDEEFDAKMRAMAAHATQMPTDSPWAAASRKQLRSYMGVEPFELAMPANQPAQANSLESDVFAGL